MSHNEKRCGTFIIAICLSGGRLLVVTLARSTCPGNTGAWCRYRAMTDIWRDMMHEKFISEVRTQCSPFIRI